MTNAPDKKIFIIDELHPVGVLVDLLKKSGLINAHYFNDPFDALDSINK